MRNGRYDHVPTLLSAEHNINASFCLLKPIEDSACYHMSGSLGALSNPYLGGLLLCGLQKSFAQKNSVTICQAEMN